MKRATVKTFRKYDWMSRVYIGIITFLVGNPYKPLFATVTGKGPHPRFIGEFLASSPDPCVGRWVPGSPPGHRFWCRLVVRSFTLLFKVEVYLHPKGSRIYFYDGNDFQGKVLSTPKKMAKNRIVRGGNIKSLRKFTWHIFCGGFNLFTQKESPCEIYILLQPMSVISDPGHWDIFGGLSTDKLPGKVKLHHGRGNP